jgi:hypothetical protein
MDLSSLSPEEKQELMAALSEPQEDPIQTLASAMELLMAKVESVEKKVDEVCKVVYDDFIGGIKDLASEKSKADRIGGLKSSYGGLFSGYSDYLGDHLDGDPDGIYPLLADRLDELKDSEGFDEKAEIERIAQEIGARVAKLTGKAVEVETKAPEGDTTAIGEGETPEEAKVGPGEIDKTPEPEKPAEGKEKSTEEEDPMAGLKKRIKGFREKGDGRVA